MNNKIDETYIIKKYFSPLSKKFKGSLCLSDDAAILDVSDRKKYIVSVDNFILGRHCPINVKAKDAINRAIITSTSDLAAMAAIPDIFFLSLSLPYKYNIKLIKELIKGIKVAMKLTNLKLAGGDICTHDGPLAICITVMGISKNKEILYRKGAKVGDKLIVTGNIGDAKVGLDCMLKKNYELSVKDEKKLIKKFLVPPILHKLSYAIRNHVNACIDLSDGLAIDAGKIASNSNCGLRLYSKKIPFSKICNKLLTKKLIKCEELISAGDDYELAFAVDNKYVRKIKNIAAKHSIELKVVGEFIKDKNVYLDNCPFNKGFSHI